MSIFQRNMAALQHQDPKLAVLVQKCPLHIDMRLEAARNSQPTLRVRGSYLHSPYDPGKEGREWADNCSQSLKAKEPVTVFGHGLGYHLIPLAERGIHGTVIEPDLAVFRLAMESIDLTHVLDRFSVIVETEEEKLRRHQKIFCGELLCHPASARLHDELCSGLRSYGEVLKTVRQGGLKVLVVDPIYGGSLPAAHHSVQALRDLGHEVVGFASEAFADGMRLLEKFRYPENRQGARQGLASLLSQSIELAVEEFSPDLVLALAQAPLLPETLAKLRGAGIPVAFWFVEDCRTLTYWQETAPHYSWFFGIQKGSFPTELAAIGAGGYHYLPTAAAPEVHMPVALTPEERAGFGSPLSFVGAGYHNRLRFFRGLVDYPFKIWGSDWPLELPLAPLIQNNAGRVDTADCVRIFNASAINLNLHSSTWHEGVVPDGDFVNPRTFEIAACGAFQLVDRRSLLDELFADDELETFSSLPELREKIDHYMQDEPGRRRLADKGRQRVLAEHTYRHRMEELLAVMLLRFPQLAERRQERHQRRVGLLAELGEQAGLSDLLARVPLGEAGRVEDIYQAIGTGEGSLSRAERIFLIMQNTPVVRGGEG